MDGEVRPLARTVHGEEAQAVYRHVVQVMVRVRQQLARPLRRRRGRDRMMRRVLLRKRHDVVIAVHRRGRAEEEGLDIHLPGELQHRLRARDVEVRTPHRILDRRPHPRLGGQVDDGVNGLPREHAAQKARVIDGLRQEPRPRVNSFLRASLKTLCTLRAAPQGHFLRALQAPMTALCCIAVSRRIRLLRTPCPRIFRLLSLCTYVFEIGS